MSLFLVIVVGLVLVSPFALTPFSRFETDWQRLSEIGQAYGGISAILSAVAVIGVVVSLAIQSKSAVLDREQAMRTMHFDLLALALSDSDLLTAFALEPGTIRTGTNRDSQGSQAAPTRSPR